MISVITPTIRLEGLKLVEKALKRETFTEWEWLIGSRDNPQLPIARWVEDDFKGGYWTLNRIYNKLIREAKGDLIVSWQDYTFADPTALEKFDFHFKTEPRTLVTAVGNKYKDDSFLEVTWKDPRERTDQGTYYPCFPSDIEWNLCAIPKELLYEVGGFMEDLDFEGYGLDGYCVNERIAELKETDFKINQTIKSYSLAHGRVKDWEENNLLHGKYEEAKKKLRAENKWPIAPYLRT